MVSPSPEKKGYGPPTHCIGARTLSRELRLEDHREQRFLVAAGDVVSDENSLREDETFVSRRASCESARSRSEDRYSDQKFKPRNEAMQNDADVRGLRCMTLRKEQSIQFITSLSSPARAAERSAFRAQAATSIATGEAAFT
jgi:hypothetical protein